MGLELVQVLCPECGVSGGSDPQASRWQCARCGSGFFLRRCSACARVSFVSGLHGFGRPWPCTWCGQFNTGFSQNRDAAAASAAELADETARYGPAASAAVHDPGRQSKARGRAGAAPRPGRRRATPRPGLRRARRLALVAAAVVACAGAASVLLTAGGPRAAGMVAARAGQGTVTRVVHVAVGRVSAVYFQGVPGRLTIVGTGGGQVTLTGQLHAAGGAPLVVTRRDRAGVLTLSVRCAPASSCTQNLRLAVPAGAGITVRQPGGQVMVAGLAGPLRVTAANADISASGLRSPSLTAAVTDGHLTAAFTAPPRRVSVTLASAQAALRLPARVAYRVIREVTSGYLHVAVPQAGGAGRTVTVSIDSGELELLPS